MKVAGVDLRLVFLDRFQSCLWSLDREFDDCDAVRAV
jgi:hypothetical protein